MESLDSSSQPQIKLEILRVHYSNVKKLSLWLTDKMINPLKYNSASNKFFKIKLTDAWKGEP